MLYLLFLLAHLFAALIFIGTVFFEVLILAKVQAQLPAGRGCWWNKASAAVPGR